MNDQHVALPAGLNASLQSMLSSYDFAFVISDCSQRDMPIVFASSKFYEMTGYPPEEVLGKNCRFLQGPETEKRKVMEIRDAIREDRCCQVCLLNYRKDGSTFLNQFFLSPIKDDQGIVTHYVGIQTDISKVAGQLHKAASLQEQQAAVAFGQAAGCRMCDVLMQQQDVALQIQQQADRQQQRQQQQKQQEAAATSADAEGDQQEQQPASDEETDIMQEEVQHARQIHDTLQQCRPHADCSLPSSLMQPLMKIQQSYVLADPRLPDCPIIHASPQFLEMTGYSREEVVGRNCRFLQGPATDPQHVAHLRAALTATPPRPVTVTLLNYTKAGKPFWNALHVAPMRDADGRLEYFIGVQLDVTEGGEQQGSDDADGLPTAPDRLHLSTKMAHYSVTGAVRVACRSLTGSAGGLRRSMDCQGLPHRGYSRRVSCDASSGTHQRHTSWGGAVPNQQHEEGVDGVEGAQRELRHVSSAPGSTGTAAAAAGVDVSL